MRILDLAPQFKGVFNNLEATFNALPTPIPVGKGGPPRDSVQRTYNPPYLFLTMIPGGTADGSLENPQELGDTHFQITAAAADQYSALHLIDLARQSLALNSITVVDQKVMSMRLQFSSHGAILDETESDPAYMAYSRWALRTSPI